MSRVKPDFLIPGFPKTGTTWIYEMLTELPDFEMPFAKELHFFNREKGYNQRELTGATHNYFLNRKRLLRNFDFKKISFLLEFIKFYESNDLLYHRLFSRMTRLTGDITPVYCLLDEGAVKRMANLLNGTKLIFVLRDPIDRAWSQYRMYLRKNNIGFETVSEMEMKNFFSKSSQKGRGAYKRAIQMFREHFYKSDLMITFYDVLENDPKSFLKNIVKFIGGNPEGVNSLVNIHSRSNTSASYQMPSEIFSYLKLQLEEEYEWLSFLLPQYVDLWVARHKGHMEPPNNLCPEFIILD